MPPTKYALKYERCEVGEPRTFIKQRKLGDGTLECIKRQMDPCATHLTPQLRIKYTAMKILCEADEEPRFRFCDLPGELRNIIYEELLVFADRKSSCFPQILATSKAINQEAKSILYECNLLHITLLDIRRIEYAWK